MKNRRSNKKSGKLASTVYKYKLTNMNLEGNLEKGKLTVTANQRDYHRVQREFQNLRTEKNMLKKSVGHLMIKKVEEPEVHRTRADRILSIVKPQFDSPPV